MAYTADVPTPAPNDQTKKWPAGEASQKQHKTEESKAYFSLFPPVLLPLLSLRGANHD
jgi:hypothetical protein